MERFIDGMNCYAPAQKNLSDRLRQIIDGEVSIVRILWKGRFHSHVVYNDERKPIDDKAPARMIVSVGLHGVKLHVKPRLGQAPAAKMPSFNTIWDKINARTPRL
jgi:hypothetical protein